MGRQIGEYVVNNLMHPESEPNLLIGVQRGGERKAPLCRNVGSRGVQR